MTATHPYDTRPHDTVVPAKCPVCDADEFELRREDCHDRLYWLPGSFEIDRCSGCGVLVTRPWPQGANLAAYYPTDYVSFGPHKGPPQGLMRALRGLVRLPYVMRYGPVNRTPAPKQPGSALLDVGCGAGAYLHQMQQLGWDVYGIEPSPAAATTAAALVLAPDRIFVGGADEADWPPASFDFVTLSHVLEHLSQPRQTLAKIHRWLRPGGRLRIWVPNIESLESRVFGRLWFGLDVPRHLVHYSPSTVRRLLETSGFAIERMVPEFQGSSLSESLHLVTDAFSRRQRRIPSSEPLYYTYRHSAPTYYITLPFASLLLGLGSWPTIDITARLA
jgi:SAM-dependent methyltransferase